MRPGRSARWWPGRCVICALAGIVATAADSVVILDPARLYAESGGPAGL